MVHRPNCNSKEDNLNRGSGLAGKQLWLTRQGTQLSSTISKIEEFLESAETLPAAEANARTRKAIKELDLRQAALEKAMNNYTSAADATDLAEEHQETIMSNISTAQDTIILAQNLLITLSLRLEDHKEGKLCEAEADNKRRNLCRNCGASTHQIAACPCGPRQNCGKQGHHTSICRQLEQKEKGTQQTQSDFKPKTQESKKTQKKPTTTNVVTVVTQPPSCKLGQDTVLHTSIRQPKLVNVGKVDLLVGQASIWNHRKSEFEEVHMTLDTGADRSLITATYAKQLGTRSQRDIVSSIVGGETESEQYGPYSSDGDEEIIEVVVEDDVEKENIGSVPSRVFYDYTQQN
ncbi:hypothetical protein NECAME_13421 [Necator americanus]|uniref:Peptidase A2 domain-containing protein n=1 Tax=Necator americanus TaxID=51031 RepID=W2SVP2_NECAM|nr:hypothetical protein NECAME_13421 [Necator americanus]ETN73789.1 hypothetical protein NECAME_13421 [Necator americanus]